MRSLWYYSRPAVFAFVAWRLWLMFNPATWIVLAALLAGLGQWLLLPVDKTKPRVQWSRGLTVVALFMGLVAGLRNNAETETAQRALATQVQKDLELAEKNLDKAIALTAQQQEMVNVMTGGDGFAFFTFRNGPFEPSCRFAVHGAYPIPAVHYEVFHFINKLTVSSQAELNNLRLHANDVERIYPEGGLEDERFPFPDGEVNRLIVLSKQGKRQFYQFIVICHREGRPYYFAYQIFELPGTKPLLTHIDAGVPLPFDELFDWTFDLVPGRRK